VHASMQVLDAHDNLFNENISSVNHVPCVNLKTFNQSHKILIQRAERKVVILHIIVHHQHLQ
jgi:hypothetical protein